LQNPERFVVVHPLTPPHLIPITEVCAGPQTCKDTIDRTMSMLRAVGQHPILLQAEIAGFALNRLLGALLNECFFLIRDGVLRVEDVDSLFTEGFGLRWSVIGPLAAMDLNAPGGIQDYLHRYGSIFRSVAKDRGAVSALDASLIDKIAVEFRQVWAGRERSERLERRDRAIAHVNMYRRTLDR
jgi:L-gulonate 3-dehydrogenase